MLSKAGKSHERTTKNTRIVRIFRAQVTFFMLVDGAGRQSIAACMAVKRLAFCKLSALNHSAPVRLAIMPPRSVRAVKVILCAFQ